MTADLAGSAFLGYTFLTSDCLIFDAAVAYLAFWGDFVSGFAVFCELIISSSSFSTCFYF